MKQKILSLLFMLLPMVVNAETVEINGLYYDLSSFTATFGHLEADVNIAGVVQSQNPLGYYGDIVIPGVVDYKGKNYVVAYIDDMAFMDCYNLVSITIPSSVSIGSLAFLSCASLECVTITPKTLPTDYEGVYSEILGNSYIGQYAFGGCSNLKRVTISNSVNRILDGFLDCNNIEDVICYADPKSLVWDDYESDRNFKPNKATRFHVSNKSDWEEAFPNANVTFVEDLLPIEFNDINYSLFRNDIITYASVISNPQGYYGNVSIPAIVKYEGVTYPVRFIEPGAFDNCTDLKSITIPNSVISISSGTFYGCNNLNSIIVDEGNTDYDSRNRCNAIIETSTNTLIAGCKSTIIPNSVINIAKFAFYGCTGLKDITIPSSVTNIGELAFLKCPGVTSITVDDGNWHYDSRYGCNAIIETLTNTLIVGCKYSYIPNSVTSIGDGAFYGCTDLKSITIPNSVTTIGENAFRECRSLTKITIPYSVINIRELAFHSCTGVTSITVDEGNSHYDSRNNCNAIIETSTNTLKLGCISTIIPNTTTTIGEYAFYRCSGLTSIAIPNSVTTIGECAFANCSGLTSVRIPNSVTSIGSSAFSGCKNIDDVYCYASPRGLFWERNDDGYCFKPDKATLFHVKNKSDWEEAFPNANVTFVEDLPMEGDANGDNDVNTADVTETANAIVGKPSSKFNKMATDMDGDNKVDVLDITRLIDILRDQK